MIAATIIESYLFANFVCSVSLLAFFYMRDGLPEGFYESPANFFRVMTLVFMAMVAFLLPVLVACWLYLIWDDYA